MPLRGWSGPEPSNRHLELGKGSNMNSSTYIVAGMTCSHCVASVTEEITKIPGVTGVRIDLTSGAVDVDSSSPLDPAALAEAVDEAGYELVAR